MQAILHAKLPRVEAPPQKVGRQRQRGGRSPGSELRAVFLPQGTPEHARFLEEIRLALARSIAAAERNFAAAGLESGSTLTVALLTNWVMTIANVGDSTAFMVCTGKLLALRDRVAESVARRLTHLQDTGESVVRISVDHNVDSNPAEVKRLQAAGATLAKLHPSLGRIAREGETGIGPTRVWPGGLALSRSFGDFDSHSALLSAPLIQQIQVPERGARFVLASDGLWALVTGEDRAASAISSVRGLHPSRAAEQLVRKGTVSALPRGILPCCPLHLTLALCPPRAELLGPQGRRDGYRGGRRASAAGRLWAALCQEEGQALRLRGTALLPPSEQFAGWPTAAMYDARQLPSCVPQDGSKSCGGLSCDHEVLACVDFGVPSEDPVVQTAFEQLTACKKAREPTPNCNGREGASTPPSPLALPRRRSPVSSGPGLGICGAGVRTLCSQRTYARCAGASSAETSTASFCPPQSIRTPRAPFPPRLDLFVSPATCQIPLCPPSIASAHNRSGHLTVTRPPNLNVHT